MYVILGCGYTGRRVARRLAGNGFPVLATTRDASRLRLPGASVAELDLDRPETITALEGLLQPGAGVLYSIPPARHGDQWLPTVPAVEPVLRQRAARVVYLSTTSVYGATRDVDGRTPPDPRIGRELVRLEEESRVLNGAWTSLILRVAAIYGPGRGIHVSMRRGSHKLWGDGGNYVSRIHVDDLAAICEAALASDLTGCFPVADDEPCTAVEIASYCAKLLRVPMPAFSRELPDEDTRRADRRVDGSAIRKALGIELRYPSYRVGIPACLEEEGCAADRGDSV
jgi:nucleoside-diphosphate-sugar epimerase